MSCPPTVPAAVPDATTARIISWSWLAVLALIGWPSTSSFAVESSDWSGAVTRLTR